MKNLVHLQGIGDVPGIKAKDLKIGMEIMWNYGSTSEVVNIEFSSTGKTLKATMKSYNGIKEQYENYERRLKSERYVAAVRPNDKWYDFLGA